MIFMVLINDSDKRSAYISQRRIIILQPSCYHIQVSSFIDQ